RRASDGVAAPSPLATPPSSWGESESRTCSIQGRLAATVAFVDLTPGRMSCANSRVGANDELISRSPLLTLSSALGSTATASRRLEDCLANDLKNSLKCGSY